MSAPETNVEKQKRRHGPVLVGIVAAVVIVIAATFAIGIWTDQDPDLQAPSDPVMSPAEDIQPDG